MHPSSSFLAPKVIALVWVLLTTTFDEVTYAADQPNILWITSEDHGPEMGCYGDSLARTPNIDRLAAKGMIYKKVWSCAPVCAPARTALITGMYPSSTGGIHMRSMVALPENAALFPELLRAAGYYCSNNNKEDYNVEKPGKLGMNRARKLIGAIVSQSSLSSPFSIRRKAMKVRFELGLINPLPIQQPSAFLLIIPTFPKCERIGPSTTTK